MVDVEASGRQYRPLEWARTPTQAVAIYRTDGDNQESIGSLIEHVIKGSYRKALLPFVLVKYDYIVII
jgi:hypothetical protein